MATSQRASVRRLASKNPAPPAAGSDPAHWIGNPPSSFRNPWPSFTSNQGVLGLLQTRFSSSRKFVPIPDTRDELVKVQKPDWGRSQTDWEGGLKVTWLGHAGFLVESAASAEPGSDVKSDKRGVRILFDAVFSDRTSPVSFAGPKRYTPLPCTLSELPDVDLIITSHDHYDHMDLVTIKQVCEQQAARGSVRPHFLAGLGNARHFLSAGAGIEESDVTECDWWDCVEVGVPGVGAIELTCTPTQHFSGRGLLDRGKALWCSWCVADGKVGKKLFFAGDTAYRASDAASACPAFKQVGDVFGGFDMALLPIGLCTPRDFMSNVHAHPEDSLEIHKDLKAKKSIGIHWGTFRGGLSMYYEDVRDPPIWWKEACEKEGRWETECGLCEVGETTVV